VASPGDLVRCGLGLHVGAGSANPWRVDRLG
jgi:hypothetical protein